MTKLERRDPQHEESNGWQGDQTHLITDVADRLAEPQPPDAAVPRGRLISGLRFS